MTNRAMTETIISAAKLARLKKSGCLQDEVNREFISILMNEIATTTGEEEADRLRQALGYAGPFKTT